jgi:hypothetical protein
LHYHHRIKTALNPIHREAIFRYELERPKGISYEAEKTQHLQIVKKEET